MAESRAIIGISGARRNAAAALAVGGELHAFCEQERVTRVRGVALTPGALPDEAVVAVLKAGGLTASAIRSYAVAEGTIRLPDGAPMASVDHHYAHAGTAFWLSPFESAAVLVCDSQPADSLSVWTGTSGGLTRLDWPVSASGFGTLYSDCSALFGFPVGTEHQLEALARLDEGFSAERFRDCILWRDGRLHVAPSWHMQIATWLQENPAGDLKHRARVASAFQRHLGTILLQVMGDIRIHTGANRLCLGGGLFYNTALATLARQSAIFEDVHVAPNPGNTGTAIGAALSASSDVSPRSALVSPFLGPEYHVEDIKRTLDNCKLSYECLSDEGIVDAAAHALARGQLVGWFQGRMEWAHRALGHRSILASPLSPYVLDNLNVFLKQRPHHRAYGVSVPEFHAPRYFDGPPTSRFMEYEYRLRDPELFRHVMPDSTKALRVQTIPVAPDGGPSPLFLQLHEAFGKISGAPVLVNTSFNGFSEPMVCSPRDAIRVFFGTGLDVLVLDRFLIRK